MVVALIIFFVKYVNNVAHDTLNWKNYPLMLISYSIALYLISIHKESEAGMLVIADALAGLQSRHDVSVVTCGLSKKTKHGK
jgi:succinate dehydrogenase hydrophobic anchor subunit